MGLASTLLGEDNPFTQWTNQNQNFLGAIASGLGQGQNIQSGLSAGLAQLPQAKQLDREAAEKLKASKLAEQQANATKSWLQNNHPDLAQMVEAGMPVSEAWQAAMDRMQPQQKNPYMSAGDGQFFNWQTGEWVTNPNGGGGSQTQDIQEYEYAKNNGFDGTFADWMQTGRNGSAGPQLGMTPQWAMDPETGKFVLGQMSSAGKFQPTDMGGLQPVDPQTMAGGKTGAVVDAKTAAAARAVLPSAEQMMEITNRAVSEVRNNANGMNEWFSQWGPRGVYVNPGSEMGKFQAAASPTNAQAFMQARNMLKGGGQITDYEGRRAEDAISRMQSAIDKGDQDQYLRALADFEQAVAEGYQKLVATAQGGYSQGGPAMPSAAPVGGVDDLVNKYLGQ